MAVSSLAYIGQAPEVQKGDRLDMLEARQASYAPQQDLRSDFQASSVTGCTPSCKGSETIRSSDRAQALARNELSYLSLQDGIDTAARICPFLMTALIHYIP